MPRQSKNSQRKVISLERQVKCLELRKAGLSFDEIGKAVGISGKQAHVLTVRALNELRQTALTLADDVRQLEICRQESLLKIVWLEAKKGNLKHIDRAQTIIQRITALHCVDVKPPAQGQIPTDLQPGEADAIATQATEDEIRLIESGDTKALTRVLERIRGR